MLLGIMSDTHDIEKKVISQIVNEFVKKGAEVIIHCGDIQSQHLDAELFAGLPVICALTEEQCNCDGKPKFKTPPGWIFTVPGERIVRYKNLVIYVGHKRSYEFIIGSEKELISFLQEFRKKYDSLRWVFSGHTHQQFFAQAIRLNRMVNPGAISNGFDGYEYALVNSENDEVTFSRILKTEPNIESFSVAVISDSGKISRKDPLFWQKFAQEMKKRNIEKIIHCGGLSLDDIGKPELEEFSIYFNLVNGQKIKEKIPLNWHLIDQDFLVQINGYDFYVKWDLSLDFLKQSEVQMNEHCLRLKAENPGLDFVLCGLTDNGLLVEGEPIKIFNPGDVYNDRNFGVISLPKNEVAISSIPF